MSTKVDYLECCHRCGLSFFLTWPEGRKVVTLRMSITAWQSRSSFEGRYNSLSIIHLNSSYKLPRCKNWRWRKGRDWKDGELLACLGPCLAGTLRHKDGQEPLREAIKAGNQRQDLGWGLERSHF
jgi:hypothetical protein